MTDTPMSALILERLPRANAKRWVSALVLKKSHDKLDSRTLYGALQWMRLRGLILRRKNAETGLYEYAKAPKRGRKE